MKKRSCILLILLSIALSACGGKAPSSTDLLDDADSLRLWSELSIRLQNDGLDATKTQALFSGLHTPPSLKPMGTKVKELYFNRFISRPASSKTSAKPAASSFGVPGPWFKGVVTRENAHKCRVFIRENLAAFRKAEVRYGVPRSTAAALLFVETRLGAFPGSQNAFYSLASMSVIRSPRTIVNYIDDLPGAWQRMDWIGARMDEKSAWAYKELKALLEYCWANGIDPMEVPGSIYGAIGLCQFMPSNISLFAEDGNGDGRIDLFAAPDAILSLSRYLHENGWREGMDMKGQVKVLMRYNRMTKYAHTILALSRLIEELDRPAAMKKEKNQAKSARGKKNKRMDPAKEKSSARTLQKRWISAKGRDVTPYLD